MAAVEVEGQCTSPVVGSVEATDGDSIPNSGEDREMSGKTTNQHSGYGKKTIGYIGGVCLLVNNCLGPGIVQFSGEFQSSGWLPSITSLLLFGALTFANGWMLLYAQSRVESSKRVEFTGLFEYYFNRYLFLTSLVIYVLTMMVLCIGGIQQTTQLMDLLFVRIFGKTCALEIYPNFMTAPCSSNTSSGFSTFESGSGVVSAGYAASALFALPFGFFPLEDNIIFQVVSAVCMGICVLLYAIDVSIEGLDISRVATMGTSVGSLVGMMLFNFSLAFSLPSWNNERRVDVSAKSSIFFALCMSGVVMVVVGLLGGFAYPENPAGSDRNLIDEVNDSNRGMSIASVYLFCLANNITTIPVFSIMIRYTFIAHKSVLTHRKWFVNLIAIAVPWLLVIPFSTGQGFTWIVDYGGCVFAGLTGFVAPPILFLCSLKPQHSPKSVEGVKEDKEVPIFEPHSDDPSRQTTGQSQLPLQDGDKQFPVIHSHRARRVMRVLAIGVLATLTASVAFFFYTTTTTTA